MKKFLLFLSILLLFQESRAVPNISFGFGNCFSYNPVTGWSVPFSGNSQGCSTPHLYIWARIYPGSGAWSGPFSASGGSFLIPPTETVLNTQLNNDGCLELTFIATCAPDIPTPWDGMQTDTVCPCREQKSCIADFSATVATSWYDASNDNDYIYYKDLFPTGFYPPFTLPPYSPSGLAYPCFFVRDTWTFDVGGTPTTSVFDNRNNPTNYTDLSMNGFYKLYNLMGGGSFDDNVCHGKAIYETNNCSMDPKYAKNNYQLKLIDSCYVCQHFCVNQPDYQYYSPFEGKSGTQGSINKAGPINLFIFPNPSLGELNLSFTSSISEEVTIHIKDISGKEINSFTEISKVGENEFRIKTGKLPTGNYLLQMISPTITFTKKITLKE